MLAAAGGNKTHFLDLEGRIPAYHRHLRFGGTPYVGELPGARRITVLESAALQSFPEWVRLLAQEARSIGKSATPCHLVLRRPFPRL